VHRHDDADAFTSHFRNAPFQIDDFIAPDDAKTCPRPACSPPNGVLDRTGLPGGCTRDLVHRYYQEQYQLDGGKQDRYVTGSDAVGLTMGYYDTSALPIYKYLHTPAIRATRSPTTSSRRVRRLVPQPPVARRGGDADVARASTTAAERPALGGRRQRHADTTTNPSTPPALHSPLATGW
jgi:hypothetical protein